MIHQDAADVANSAVYRFAQLLDAALSCIETWSLQLLHAVKDRAQMPLFWVWHLAN